ncbi:phage terminase large subunit [soil metagenome]
MTEKVDVHQKMIDDARELYLKYGGRQHARIESEMRSKGWIFNRQRLYNALHKYGVTPGWPELYGWVKLLPKNARRAKKSGDRKRFEVWLKANFPEFNWSWKYQRYIYRVLERISTGECKRLMIFMPPRHGKSEMVTVRYTAWRLLQDLKLNVIIGSYNQRLADRFSRKIRRIIENEKWRIENADLKEPSNSQLSTLNSAFRRLATASEWETSGGGVVRSVGVGGGIAGFGGGLIVIDDPVRNRADAESETYRERVWDWFTDDIYTRMEPDAAIILIQTRWHEDDLAGRLLREADEGGEKWEVIRLPALAEGEIENEELRIENEGGGGVAARPDGDVTEKQSLSANRAAEPLTPNSRLSILNSQSSADPLGRKLGEALCPKRYPVATLQRYRRKLGSYSFASLYQQSPMPRDGGRFKRSWFKNIIDRAPDGLKWKRGYDLAVSLKTSADYTASVRCAKDSAGNLYIDGGFRKRIEYPDQRKFIVERMQTEPNTEHGVESALHGKAVIQDLRSDWRLRRYAFRAIRVEGDKLTRALAWLNLAEEGRVFLIRGPWIEDFVNEVCQFPVGRHDDQIDAVSIAVSMIHQPSSKLHRFV